MFLRTKNRKAISAVLTTLIILVASVVLGTGVVLYGTSLFQTGAQSSGVSTQGVHVWANSTSTPTYVWGAAEVRNSGDKILSVNTISVRGTQIPFANWYYDSNPIRITAANFQSQLTYTGTTDYTGGPLGMMKSTNSTVLTNCLAQASGTKFAINEFATWSASTPSMCFSQASGPISLKPGDKAIVYYQVPAGILGTVDAGSQSSVAVYAGNVGAPQSVTVESK
ncbi:hypothetical protein, partial [Candidatus Nitrosotalea sp. FS]|uniref:hypothetical protein n=1 Tax=Candidatus Nitrosotalea sp. FS TaxID=2341021 RepID=UPI0015AE3B11